MKKVLIAGVRFYQRYLSPFKRYRCCKYIPSCSQYAIEALEKSGKLDRLPEKLQQTARLRLEHPELSLAQLAELCDPPVSKSCMNHRLRKLNEEAKKIL